MYTQTAYANMEKMMSEHRNPPAVRKYCAMCADLRQEKHLQLYLHVQKTVMELTSLTKCQGIKVQGCVFKCFHYKDWVNWSI